MEITVPFASYKYLRFIAVFAGLLGVAQSLAWIGMSVSAILAYYCSFSFVDVSANYGTILQITIFQMYFRGDCTPNGWPTVDFSAIADLDLMEPSFVHIWMWVVASLSLVWLFSSVTLITNVKKSNLRHLNVFLYLWILITFVISMIDLVLFVLFILDYDTILQHSLATTLNFAVSTEAILITAQNTSGMLASIALRGYFLWLINLGLTVFLFTQTFKVFDYNRMSKITMNGQTNQAFKNDELQGHSIFKNQPIQAFNTEQPQRENHPWYNYLTSNEIPRVQRPYSQMPPPMARSKSTSNLDESFQKRQSMAAQPNEVVLRREQVQKELKNRQSINSSLEGYSQTPQPPAGPYEARPQLRSALRTSRYQ